MKRRLPALGIRAQLTLWYTAIFALALLVAGGVFYGALKLTLDTHVDSELATRAATITRGIAWQNGAITIHDVSGSLPGLGLPPATQTVDPTADTAVWVRVLDAHGAIIYASPAFVDRLLPAASVQDPLAGQTWQESERITGVDYVRFLSMPLVDNHTVYGILQVGQSLALVTTTLTISAAVLAVLAPVLLLGGAAGSYWLAGRAFAPVRRLTRLADQVQAGGDLRRRVPIPPARDEVRDLALTLNAMLTRLDGAFAVQRRFVADASHDLRTPVAAILSLAENGRDGVGATDARASLASIATQAQRLRQLITNLLQLSRADEGLLPMEREPVPLAALAQDVVASLVPLAQERDITLTAGRLDAATVEGDLAQLLLILMNLIDNALTYTPPGGQVQVHVVYDDGQVACIVQDTGMGIAPEDLPHIFERFYRADPARQRATGGSGLGLAIVQTLVAAHGGNVSVTSRVGQGTRFVVVLPAASADGERAVKNRA